MPAHPRQKHYKSSHSNIRFAILQDCKLSEWSEWSTPFCEAWEKQDVFSNGISKLYRTFVDSHSFARVFALAIVGLQLQIMRVVRHVKGLDLKSARAREKNSAISGVNFWARGRQVFLPRTLNSTKACVAACHDKDPGIERALQVHHDPHSQCCKDCVLGEWSEWTACASALDNKCARSIQNPPSQFPIW